MEHDHGCDRQGLVRLFADFVGDLHRCTDLRHRQSAASKRLVSKGRFRHEADLEDWNKPFDRGVPNVETRDSQTSFWNWSGSIRDGLVRQVG